MKSTPAVQRASIDLSTLQYQYDPTQANILYVVEHQGDNDQPYQANNSQASLGLQNYLNSVQYRYEEALVLDLQGMCFFHLTHPTWG